MARITHTASGFLACVIAGGVATAGATTQPGSPVGPATTVGYADLNLNDPRDVATLYHRLQVAAGKLCGPRAVGGPDIESLVYYYCVNEAVDRAVTAVSRPALSAYQMTRGRRPH